MATELKADSWRRYMLYRADDSSLMPFASRDQKRAAMEAGKKFTMAAYPETWAEDAQLIDRVRLFFRESFHWHDRFATSGSDLELMQTLFDMVRGGSIAVVPEQPQRTGGITWPPRKPESLFWGVENYDETPFVPLKERYLAQLKRMNAGRPTWAETQPMMDGINAHFMAKLAGRSPSLDALFRAAAWTDKYADTAPKSSLLDDAAPFEFRPFDATGLGDAFEIAKTPNEGAPGTWYTNPGSGQMRMYGSSGRPAVDFDFDHDHGQGIPHAHNWAIDPLTGRLKRGPGLPMSILP